jgi:hypothetical protein
MEEGLEVRASAATRETWRTGRRKGERARFAVNVKVGNDRHGDAGPRRAGIRPGDRRCRRREGFEGQKVHGGEPCFATGGNAVNPTIGSGLKMVAGSRRNKPPRW